MTKQTMGQITFWLSIAFAIAWMLLGNETAAAVWTAASMVIARIEAYGRG